MVEDRVTDGERVAQLLASELSGRNDGSLSRLSVVDADREATPSPEGTVAYGIAVDGQRVADVRIYPDGAEVTLDTTDGSIDVEGVADAVRGSGLAVETDESGTVDDGGTVLRVEYGAAIKRAVDALVAGVER